jgi:hypothetical protein
VFLNTIIARLWSAVPADFGEVGNLLENLLTDPGQSVLLVKAPTGVGKSTTMVVYLATHFPSVRHTVVIEPRVLLATGLATYVNSKFGVSTTAGASGSLFDPAAKIWYMTPASFMVHIHLLKDDFLLVLDEAHLEEPAYDWFRGHLHKLGCKVVWTTATPNKLMHQADLFIDVPIAQVFDSVLERRPIPGPSHYIRESVDLVNSHPPFRRCLVILDTPEQCESALSRSRYPGQVLSSRHPPVVVKTSRYFATSVVDLGVTIEDLELVITPNWVYHGSGSRSALDDTTLAQRRGRTGRTCNGTLLVLEATAGLELSPKPHVDSSEAWSDFISAGVPVALAAALDPVGVSHLYGVKMPSARSLLESKALLQELGHVDKILTEWSSLRSIQGDLPKPLEAPILLKPASGGLRFSTRHKGFNNAWSLSKMAVAEIVEAWQEKRSPSVEKLVAKARAKGLDKLLTAYGGSAATRFGRFLKAPTKQARSWQSVLNEALCYNNDPGLWDDEDLAAMLETLAALPSDVKDAA